MIINYKKPDFFYTKQQDIYSCPSRFVYTLSGNKLGKTFSHCIWLSEKCLEGGGKEFAWLGPFFKTSEIAYNLLKKLIQNSELYKKLEEEKSNFQFHFNNSKMRITYPNQNIINFFSAENFNSVYGYEIHAAVVDEASRMKEEAYRALLSTLFATGGPVRLISNPTIKNNWFYNLWEKVYSLEGHTSGEETAFKLTAHDAIEAGIMPKSVYDFAEKNYSRAIFRRDFLAEVPDQDVSVFKQDMIYKNILEEELENSLSKVIFLGVDLGFTESQRADYTVVVGLDKKCQLRFFKRFKKEGKNLINILKSYIGSKRAYIDATGGGITVFHLLKEFCPNLKPYSFNNKTKILCIENLAYYINSGKIKYNNNQFLIDELIGYEIETTPSGKTTYNNGKKSEHDDTVIALGLAALKYSEVMEKDKEPTGELYIIENENENYNFSYNLY